MLEMNKQIKIIVFLAYLSFCSCIIAIAGRFEWFLRAVVSSRYRVSDSDEFEPKY